jgi:hypothetical protein
MSNHSLGQALLERSAVIAKLEDILKRICSHGIVIVKQDGSSDIPNEDVKKLFEELIILENRRDQITSAILHGNYSTTVIYDNKEYRLIEIIELIDSLKGRIKRVRDLITKFDEDTEPKSKSRYYGDDKEKYKCIMDISELRNIADKYSCKKNELQVLLQSANWSTHIKY